MAAKLEAAVSNRRKSRLACNHLKDSFSTDNKAEHGPNKFMKLNGDTCAEETEDPKELCTAYKEIFLNIKLATSVDDFEKSFQLLNHARRLALELTNR